MSTRGWGVGGPKLPLESKDGAYLRCLTSGGGLNESDKQAHSSQAGVLQHLQQTLAITHLGSTQKALNCEGKKHIHKVLGCA